MESIVALKRGIGLAFPLEDQVSSTVWRLHSRALQGLAPKPRAEWRSFGSDRREVKAA
jgi:hypothetical protein